jgi:hypothetical protein
LVRAKTGEPYPYVNLLRGDLNIRFQIDEHNKS